MIKRTFIVALCVVLFCIGTMPVIFAEGDSRPKWYYDETFEEVPNGARPHTVQITSNLTGGSNSLGVTTLADGNKAYHFDVNSEDEYLNGDIIHTKIPFETMGENKPKGNVVMQWRMKLDNQSGCYVRVVNYSSAGTQTDSAANYHEVLNINKYDKRGIFVNNTFVPDTQLPDDTTSTAFVTIAMALDMTNYTMDIYLNGVMISQNVNVKKTFFDMESLRFSLYGIKKECNTSMYLDDVYVYEGTKPLSEEEIYSTEWNYVGKSRSSVATEKFLSIAMNNRAAFLADSPYLYGHDRKKIMQVGSTQCQAYRDGNTLMIPVAAAITALGGTVDVCSPSEVCGSIGTKQTIITDGTVKDGILYASLETIAEATCTQVHYDADSGFAVLGNRDFNYTWQEEPELLRALFANLTYDRPCGSELVSKVKEKYPITDRNNADKDGHPRLVLNDASFERIRSEIETSSIKQAWLWSMESRARYFKTYYDREEYTDFNSTNTTRITNFTDNLKNLIVYDAFMYQIYKYSDSEKAKDYAEIAWNMMEQFCARPTWGGKTDSNLNALMGGRCIYSMALAYDWLYDYLTETQRQTILGCVKNKMMPTWIASYDSTDDAYSATWWTFGEQGDNWNPIAARGAIFMSLAVCDESSDAELAAMAEHLLERAVYALERGVNSLMPSGAWYEGLGYWQSTVESIVDNVSALESCAGSDFGFLRVPGFHKTGYFPIDLTGVYCHNFGNASEKELYRTDLSSLYYLADRYDDDFLKNVRYSALVEAMQKNVNGICPSYRDFAFCNGEPEEEMPDYTSLSPDYYYERSEVAGMRSGWNPDSSLFVSMETARGYNNSSANDAGSFVLDAYGQRFITDLGSDQYDTVGSHQLLAYRYRAEGHNTLVINPEKGDFDTTENYNKFYDQNPDAWSYIDRFNSNDVSSYAITDLSDVYSFWNANVRRGIRMEDNRSAVLVQDEITLSEPGEIYWFAHTQADVSIAADGRSAILTRGGEQLKAEIVSQDGVFTMMAAQPLPTSPSASDVEGYSDASHPYYKYYKSFSSLANQLNGKYATSGVEGVEDFKKLTIHLTDTEDTTLAVLFTPIDNLHEDFSSVVVPLSNWTLDEPKMVEESLPVLSSIKVNSNEIEEFDPAVTLYEITSYKQEMPIISALNESGTTEGVRVSYPQSIPGTATVTVAEEGKTNTYGIIIRYPVINETMITIEEPKEVLLYLVSLYKQDGTLVSVKCLNSAPVPGTVMSLTSTIPSPATDYYMKAMLWSKEKMLPITAGDELETLTP